jgi:superfamily II DNA or RNA helicase
MEPKKKEEIKLALEAGTIDIIVQVKMLGEGYDLPTLSVAAIFYPPGSLAPFAQFVGRAVRRLRASGANQLNAGDNICYIISHPLMHMHSLWLEYVANGHHNHKLPIKHKLGNDVEEYEVTEEVLGPVEVTQIDFLVQDDLLRAANYVLPDGKDIDA